MTKMKTTFLCRLFGHKRIGRGWWGDGLYGRVRYETSDNLGTMHFSVFDECTRCQESFRVARFHHYRVLDAIINYHLELIEQAQRKASQP